MKFNQIIINISSLARCNASQIPRHQSHCVSEYGTGICRLIYIAITNISLVAFTVHAVVRAQLKYSGYDNTMSGIFRKIKFCC